MGHPLSIMVKPASDMCTMDCAYCFYHDEMAQRKEADRGFMSQETMHQIIVKALKEARGSVSIAFQGGEPTLRGRKFFEDAFAFADEHNSRHIPLHWSIQTNGLALDSEWCGLFREHEVLVGISLDGTRAIHDAWRHDRTGNATYERVVRSCALLKDAGVSFNILTVVTGQAAGKAPAIYQNLKRLGSGWLQFIPCMDSLDESKEAGLWHLGAEEYGTFLNGLFASWYRDAQKGVQPHIRLFDNWMGILQGYLPEACDMRGICSDQYVFEADGTCYPCDFYMTDPFCLGQIAKDSFEDFDQARDGMHFIEPSQRLPKRCHACPYVNICRGGCMRYRDAEGTYRFCASYEKFFRASLPKMLTLAAEAKQ